MVLRHSRTRKPSTSSLSRAQSPMSSPVSRYFQTAPVVMSETLVTEPGTTTRSKGFESVSAGEPLSVIRKVIVLVLGGVAFLTVLVDRANAGRAQHQYCECRRTIVGHTQGHSIGAARRRIGGCPGEKAGGGIDAGS